MSSAAQKQRGLRLLALDGGGIRGLSELLILHEIMTLVQSKIGSNQLPLPCDYFDLIGGTSTGGLIALMLGRFRMSTQQAIDQYRKLAEKIFLKKRHGKEMFRATGLTEAIKEVVKEHGNSLDGESVMLDDRPNACFTFVCAQSAESVGSPALFRTYNVPRDGGGREQCKIWEAARATTAAPTLFKPIEISTRQKFIDGGVGCNNPTKAVLEEAKSLFDNYRLVDCILSLGTGTPKVNNLKEANFAQKFFPTHIIRVLKEVATDCETMAEELQGRYKRTPGVYIRLNVDQGMQGVALEEWKKFGDVTTCTQQYLRRTTVSGLVDMAVAALVGEGNVKALTLEQLLSIISSEPMMFNVHSTVPHSVSPLFTGREDVLERLRDYLFAPNSLNQRRVFVLYGLGGAGKTQISLEFIRRYGDRFGGIFWVDASTTDMIKQSFYDIAQEVGIETSPKAAKRWLEKCQKEYQWLLVIDNANNIDLDLETLFPCGRRGKILVTTRNLQCTLHSPDGYLEVDSMRPDEAIELLLKAAKVGKLSNEDSQEELAAKLSHDLGYLALAIAHAGAYIASCSTMRRYLELLHDHPKEVLNTGPTQGSEAYNGKTVFTTWELSFREISVKDPSASEILQLFAFLHYDRIPEEIFKHACNIRREPPKLSKPLIDLALRRPDGTWDPINFERSIRTLLSFSLIKQDTYKERKIYSVHPLVHSWSRNRLEVNEQVTFRGSARILLECSVKYTPSSDPRFLLQFMPHIQSWKSTFRGCDYNSEPACLEISVQPPIFWKVYSAAGMWKQAEELQQVELKICKEELDEKHPDTLSSMGNLASTYWNQGRLKDAEDLQLVVLEAREQVLGKEHPDTLTSMNNLASTYWNQGRWKGAEDLEMVVLRVRERVLGKEHPETLTSMSNLAETYRNQGRLKDAEDLDMVVVEVRKRVLGKEHLNTLASMSNLASTYWNQERWKDAEDLQLVVLKARERVLSKEHPNTLTSMSNLASTYWKQGRLKDAEDLQLVVLEARERVLGKEHPDTLSSMSNLASTYWSQKRWKEAEDIQLVVLKARERVLGKEHPDTLASMNNLVSTYRNQERWKDVEGLQLVVLEVSERVLGKEHPNTLASMSNLASTYRCQERWKDAEDLQLVVLEVMERVLGKEHPNTLISMSNLASTYQFQERWEDAEDLQLVVLRVRERVLGKEHLNTLASMSNLVSMYRSQERWKDAEDLQSVVLEVMERVLGKEHPNTLASMSNLASMYRSQERLKDAEDLQLVVLKVRERVLGKEHPNTLTSMNNLASTYRSQERWKDAEGLQLVVLEVRERVLGKEHPGTLSSMSDLASTYQMQGRWEEAEELQVLEVEVWKRDFGEAHPGALIAMKNLAWTHQNQESKKATKIHPLNEDFSIS